MLRRIVVLSGLLLAVGCQSSSPPEYVSPPALTPPVVSPTPRPVPRPQPNPRQQYAGRAPRGWAPAAAPNAWRWIVIHHSDTAVGSAAAFDRYHREVKHWGSLGYHFVIGNGTGSGNGQVEVGPRWVRQQKGAHAGVLIYNEYGVGICLVGNFDRTRPTQAQLDSLTRLVAYLMRCYHIPPQNVIGHNQAKEGRTHCPGRYMNVAAIRRSAARLASADDILLPLNPPALAMQTAPERK